MQARALGLAEPAEADQAESRRLMRERGLSPQAARAIAAVVPPAYVRAQLATVPQGRGANPAGVVAAALWRDDADWFANEKRRRDRAVSVQLAEDRRSVDRATHADTVRAAAAANAAMRAKLAHLTEAQVVALITAARERMPHGAEREEIRKLFWQRRRTNPLLSPTLCEMAITEYESHGLPDAASSPRRAALVPA